MDSGEDLGKVEVVEVDSGEDLGKVEVVGVVSGEGAMREVAVVSEVDAAVLEENAAVLKVIATSVIRVAVGATIVLRMVLTTRADVGAMETIRMAVAAILEAVVAVLEAAAAAVVSEAVLRIENLGVEMINRGNRGVIAGMAREEVSKAVSIRNPLISIHLLKIKKSLLMIK